VADRPSQTCQLDTEFVLVRTIRSQSDSNSTFPTRESSGVQISAVVLCQCTRTAGKRPTIYRSSTF